MANVSHELRTPLSIIQGAGTEAERNKYLAETHEEILRLRRLVTEILDLRKIEAGGVELKRQQISLAHLTSQVYKQFQALAEDKEVTASLDVAPGSYTVNADSDRIRQVLITVGQRGAGNPCGWAG